MLHLAIDRLPLQRNRWKARQLSVSSPLYGHGKVLRPKNVRSVKAAFAVKEVHIAMFAAFAYFMATMPGIPDNHFFFPLLQYNYITPTSRWVLTLEIMLDGIGKDISLTFAVFLSVLLTAKHNGLQ